MEDRKEHLQAHYSTKKHHQKLEKQHRKQIGKSTIKSGDLESVMHMGHRTLLKFIDKKFETFAFNHPEQYKDLKKNILNRLKQLQKEYIAYHKKLFTDYVTKIGLNITTDEQYKDLFWTNRGHQIPRTLKCEFVKEMIGKEQIYFKKIINRDDIEKIDRYFFDIQFDFEIEVMRFEIDYLEQVRTFLSVLQKIDERTGTSIGQQ